MRVKNLIDLLRNLDPNVNVTFKLGYDDEYRQKCAKVEIIDCECLAYLDVDSLSVFPGDASGNPECAFLILEEFNYEKNLDKVAAEFDATYKKSGKRKWQMKIGRVEIAPNGAIEQRWKRDARSLKYVLESWEPGALRFAMAFALRDMDKEYSKQIQGAVNDYKKNLKQKEN